MVSPIPNWRKDTAYPANGWDPKSHPSDFIARPRKDIGEGGIDAEVHGMASANNMVSPIPNWRKEEAYNNNGWDPKAHPADFMASRDIHNEEVRPDVYKVVFDNVSPWPIKKQEEEPKEYENPWDKEEDLVRENLERQWREHGVFQKKIAQEKALKEAEEERKEAKAEAQAAKNKEYRDKLEAEIAANAAAGTPGGKVVKSDGQKAKEAINK